MKKKKIIISNFNKYFISVIIFIFFTLFYLSIPTLYDKGRLQKALGTILLNEFKLNLSLSSEIDYYILPSPHFIISNSKLFWDKESTIQEVVNIKKLNVYISKENLFNQKKIKVNKILLDDANFSITKKDFPYLQNYFKNELSKKKIVIKDSNLFYKKKDETIFIVSMNNFDMHFNQKKKSK